MKQILTILLCITISFPAFATYSQVINHKKSEYKAGAQNWKITQNSGGFLYFANNAGLLEYDGIRWENYSLQNQAILRTVYYDSESDRIYVGSFNELGYFSLSDSGKMQYTSLSEGLLNISEIWEIHKVGEIFYLQDETHIYRFDPVSNDLTTFNIGVKIYGSTLLGSTLYIPTIEKGLLAIPINTLESLSSETQVDIDESYRLPNTSKLIGEKISAILPYSYDCILIVTELEGLYTYSNKKLQRLRTSIDNTLDVTQIYCAALSGKILALGTISDGLYIFDMEANECSHLDIFSGLQNNSVLCLYFDDSGNLWAGLDRGIDCVCINSPIQSVFGSEKLYGSGYCSIVHNNKLYLGTNQGLYSTYLPANKRLKMDTEFAAVKGLSGQVWCLNLIGNDLFCGNDTGLYLISGNSATRIYGIAGVWKIIQWQNEPNIAIGCSYTGLFFLEKSNGRWKLKHFVKGFNESTTNFAVDNDDKIWFHHWIHGLFRLSLDPQRDSVTLVEPFTTEKGLPTNHNNMVNTVSGNYIFSSEGGFYQYNEQTDLMEPILALNELLPSLPIAVGIQESPYSDLVFLSGNIGAIAINDGGTYSVDNTTLQCLQTERILGFDHINWIDRNNFIINTEKGFSWVDLNKSRIDQKSEPRGVVLKNVKINSDSLIFGARSYQSESCTFSTNYRNNTISFEFVAPTYDAKETMLYSYILENNDKQWSSYSAANIKEYSNLRSGTYTFRVRAKDLYSDNVTDTSFTFTIQSPWYSTVLAWIIYVILFIIGIYLLIHVFQLRQKRQFEIETRKKENEIMALTNQNLEREIKHKSQDLANSTMNVIRKNEILIRIKHSLSKVYEEIETKEDSSKTLKRLQKLQIEIAENIDHDDDWKKFSGNFDDVYNDYLQRLKSTYPQLSTSDLKLCAYLRMDLSTKDIATMQNISSHSVDMARYRLRQKLNLRRESNLTDFLQNF